MEWYDVFTEYHRRTLDRDGALSSLPTEWQRELAAVGRLSEEVNSGGYLQFVVNWDRENYVYVSRALQTIGARTAAGIVDRCQALVEKHFLTEDTSRHERRALFPNQVIGAKGRTVKLPGSVLPPSVLAQLAELSQELMNFPDDFVRLSFDHYREQILTDYPSLR